MLTGILIGALALIAFLYVAVPLLAPGQADPLPDDRDPVLVDMGEERDALFRAIRELDAREDLALERRQQLHERYEAKAAQVLARIDARKQELSGRPPSRSATAEAAPQPDAAKRRVPYGAIAVLALLVAIGALVPTFVLPRVGQDANITTTDVEIARQLQAQQRAAEQDPSITNLLALGDTYLGLQQLDDAEETYMRAVNSDEPAPAGIYQRLAIIYLQKDLTESQRWLTLARDADPNDIDTLFLLGEVSWAINDLPTAQDAYSDFLAAAGEPEPQVLQRVELLQRISPLTQAVQEQPSTDLLLQLGDAFWQAGEPQRAVESYFRILTEFDPMQPIALARTGQLLLLAGRPDDAVGTLERAATAAGGLTNLEPDSLRALADAQLQLGEWAPAADSYQAYIQMVGADAAGDAPDLLAAASTRAAGGADNGSSGDVIDQIVGEQVFVANCAQCHGLQGEGGVGVTLAGNSRAANSTNVLDAVRFGRGLMPAFQAQLTDDQIRAVAAYVTGVLAGR
jgi:mono/diheme cytochrome c family protein/cytochrome c-type biogenesis protein CcmH/NrfG